MNQTEAYIFSDVGGALCLDFANTVSSHYEEQPNERLNSYSDLLEWARQRNVLSEGEIVDLAGQAARRPNDSEGALRRAIELRGAIYHIFAAVSSGRPAPAESLSMLNRHLATALPHDIIVEGEAGFAWGCQSDGSELDKMLWPVARSAADLLVSGQVARVRECGGHDCGWLFVDTSKNKSRRWCDMGDCGNRAKAHRHYSRRKAVGSSR